MDLLAGEEVIWEGHPTWRSILSFYVKWTLAALVPLAVIIVANAASASLPTWIGIVIFVAGFVLLLFVGWVRRHFTRYRITTKHLLIRTGILARNESSASIDRVQNIKVIQSPIERLLRTGSIDFDTAAGEASDAELRFVGIDHPRDVRDRILAAVEKIRSADRQGGLG